jgi:Uma2 family endonuclease
MVDEMLRWYAAGGLLALCYSRPPAMEKDVSTNPKKRITPQEYLEFERDAEVKSEYIDGEVFLRSGVSREHARIVLNIAAYLHAKFEGRSCEVYASELRTKVSQTGSYAYPDVVALCGEVRFEDEQLDTLVNPQLIVEVLSDSTESYDRGKKFAHYRTIDSLREYVLVSQTECRVERFSRQDDATWLYGENTDPNGAIELASVACRIPLARIYQRVDFEGAHQDPTAS